MERINKDIRDNYSKFQALTKGYKECSVKVVELSERRKNHPNTRQRIVNVTHEKEPDEIKLIVESKVIDKRSYKFKLQSVNFTAEPYFRFDSDGPSHYNRSLKVPLPDQKVDTPHFNSFDENGKSIAYKTEALNSKENVEAILSDIALGMAHYCDEANIFHQKGYIGVNQISSGELNLDLENMTPLDGAEYD